MSNSGATKRSKEEKTRMLTREITISYINEKKNRDITRLYRATTLMQVKRSDSDWGKKSQSLLLLCENGQHVQQPQNDTSSVHQEKKARKFKPSSVDEITIPFMNQVNNLIKTSERKL